MCRAASPLVSAQSSFAGGVLSPHIDLVDLPGKVTQHAGAAVVEHLAETVLLEDERV